MFKTMSLTISFYLLISLLAIYPIQSHALNFKTNLKQDLLKFTLEIVMLES